MSKKMVSILIMALVFSVLLVPNSFATGNGNTVEGGPSSLPIIDYPILYGDVNRDGVVNSLDLAFMNRIINPNGEWMITDEFITEADLNGDWDINSTDYDLLKSYILRKIDKFPVEDRLRIES